MNELEAIEQRAREAIEHAQRTADGPDDDVPLSELMRLGARSQMAHDTLRLVELIKGAPNPGFLRRGLFLSDLPSAEWIIYVRDLEAAYQAAKAHVEYMNKPVKQLTVDDLRKKPGRDLAAAVRQVDGEA